MVMNIPVKTAKILILSLFLILFLYGCSNDDVKAPKIYQESIAIDLSYSDKWLVNIWKIRNRKLLRKWWRG